MSKLLGLNASNILEPLKSISNNLLTQSKSMGLNDSGGQSQIRTDNSGNLVSQTIGVYYETPFTLGDGASTMVQLDINGNLKVREQVKTETQVLEQTLANGEDSNVIDCRNMKSIRIYGNNSTLSILSIQYASTNDYGGGGVYDWQYVDTLMAIDYYGNFQINKLIDTPPSFMRIANNTGSSQQFSLRVIKIN
tara:strand:- start:1796 stop:2374 length:579 start_codon:yes stop_codon:yes gene_type:complete